ncbi:G patch domain-containing protein 1 isoform X2 [Pelodiscus sinensis]|uniref:G-patch domain containing 1 n=1 Tax=Pelodiscus sinensis TaxID=13735 RepID=K7G4M1_PELSI|nr:G patch domain-containing protein 1 isoform X2 [Pelodiscus sinensis]|eukprot:XP_006114992.1 G patch domain-containing protein 1 isoform X2 [Pelodiscus sinensis]
MEASDSEEEDLASYGTSLEPLLEGQRIKKPVPLQEQTVKDEKGRYKRFHGAFSGGFSAGYFNTVGSKEGWAPSTFVSSRQKRADKRVLGPEDFMDEEDLGEYGIAPKEITTTEDFASKHKDRIKEKARQIAEVASSIPGATALGDLISPAKITIGVELLRKMGWKEGQGVGPRVKRKPRKQKSDPEVKVYGCALPPDGSEDEEDEYQPENVTFAPKDVMPVDLTPKENVHGLGYKGLDPTKALFGVSGGGDFSLFTDGSENTSNLLGDLRPSKGRKLGISGQAFGVGAMEEEDEDIYATETLSKYDTVLKDEEPGDCLYGWTAPKQYKNKKEVEKEVRYIGKILDGFCLASKSSAPKKTYLPPELPRDYRPVHYFRPVITARNENPFLLQALVESTGKLETDTPQESRHTLNASQRRELLGETALEGPSPSVLEYLSGKDRERIKEVKQAAEQQMKIQTFSQQSVNRSSSSDGAHHKWQMVLGGQIAIPGSSDFKPFAKNPEKQKRYEDYIESLKQGQKVDTQESRSDPGMTEWERGREREEFFKAAVLYKSSNSILSSRFTRAKYEDDTDKVEVPRDQETDIDDKESAVKMKMFGKLTRDKFEWHPEKLLCKRFNVPDPYSDSSIVGLPKVKRDKYSVFNFLTLSESSTTTVTQTTEKMPQNINPNKPKKPSRWDVSDKEKKRKDSISEFISLARSKVENQQQLPESTKEEARNRTKEPLTNKVVNESTDQEEEEESRPSMDLFKAIFASSSDEKSSSSSSEEDSDEEVHQPTSAVPDSESGSHANPPDTSVSEVQENMAVTNEPDFVPPLLKEELNKGEEFGPKLPPVFFSKTTQKPESVLLSSSPEVNKKEKHKKNKEKYKAKREHKHKKEKKKKHKKHRHKGKHKNKKSEKSSSSDTADSSDSLSDVEKITNLSPQEFLQRLKCLPARKQ